MTTLNTASAHIDIQELQKNYSEIFSNVKDENIDQVLSQCYIRTVVENGVEHLTLEKHRPWSITDWFRRAWNHKEYTVVSESTTYQHLQNLIETLNTEKSPEKSPSISKQEDTDNIVKVLVKILQRISDKSKPAAKQQKEAISTLFTDRVSSSQITNTPTSVPLQPKAQEPISIPQTTTVPTEPQTTETPKEAAKTITKQQAQNTEPPRTSLARTLQTARKEPEKTTPKQQAQTQATSQRVLRSANKSISQQPAETPKTVKKPPEPTVPTSIKTQKFVQQPKPIPKQSNKSSGTVKKQTEPPVTKVSTPIANKPTTSKPVPQKVIQEIVQKSEPIPQESIKIPSDTKKQIEPPVTNIPTPIVNKPITSKPVPQEVTAKPIEIPQSVTSDEDEPCGTYQELFRQIRASSTFVDFDQIDKLTGLQDDDYILTIARNDKGYHAALQVWRAKDNEFKHIPLLVRPQSGLIHVDTIGSDRPKDLPLAKPKAPTDKVEILPLYSAIGHVPSCPSVRTLEKALEEKGLHSIRKRQAT